MSGRRFIKNTIFIAAIVWAGWYGYSWIAGAPAGGGQRPEGMMPGGAPPVSVAEVVTKDVQQWREFSGRIVAVDQVDIRPRVSGAIESIHFKNGAMVKKGDLLFTIDTRPFKAALQAAQARADLAQSEFARAEGLVAEKAIPQREYDQRKNDLEVAQAELTNAKLNLEYARIKAPISGRVGRAEITVGNIVNAGNDVPVLTTVVSQSPIYADFEIDENTFLKYGHDMKQQDSSRIPVTLTLGTDGDISYEGYIESFDNRLNTDSGTIRARAIFDNEGGHLVPGLFARVRLGSAGTSEVLLITDRAVGTDQSKKFVLVVGADNKVEYREITLGGQAEGLRIIESGLKAGEKIIVNGLQRTRPGMSVTPEPVAMDAAEAAPGTPPKE